MPIWAAIKPNWVRLVTPSHELPMYALSSRLMPLQMTLIHADIMRCSLALVLLRSPNTTAHIMRSWNMWKDY